MPSPRPREAGAWVARTQRGVLTRRGRGRWCPASRTSGARARPGWGRSPGRMRAAGRAGAVPGRACSLGPTAETREAFRPGVRRPRRPHHGFGSRELRAQRRPESGLPRLPGLLSKLPSPAPLCDIGWRPPSLDSAPAEPGYLSAPASCARVRTAGWLGSPPSASPAPSGARAVVPGLPLSRQVNRGAGRAGRLPTPPRDPAFPLLHRTLTYCCLFSSRSLRARGGRGGSQPLGPRPAAGRQLRHPRCPRRPHNLVHALMGNLGPLWPRSSLHPQALCQPVQSALPTWEGRAVGTRQALAIVPPPH